MFEQKISIEQHKKELEQQKSNIILEMNNDFENREIEFGHKNDLAIYKLKQEHELAIGKLKAEHAIEIKQKDFDIKTFKDKELHDMKSKMVEQAKQLAVFENENKMLRETINLNADLIDVKDLVKSLIKKLPEVNINSINVNGTNNN